MAFWTKRQIEDEKARDLEAHETALDWLVIFKAGGGSVPDDDDVAAARFIYTTARARELTERAAQATKYKITFPLRRADLWKLEARMRLLAEAAEYARASVEAYRKLYPGAPTPDVLRALCAEEEGAT